MDRARRTLTILATSFAVGGIIIVAILSVIDFGEPASPDLADGASLAAAAFGAVGLVLALVWSSRTGERLTTPNRVMVSFVLRVAIAELGLFMGILGWVMTGAVVPPYIGLGCFLVSLLVLTAGLRRIST